MAAALVTGGVHWAGDGGSGGRPPAGAAAHGRTAAAPAEAKGGGTRPGDRSTVRPRPRATARAVPPPRPAPPPAALPRSRPTLVAVPAITVEAPVTDLALDRAGRLGVPPVDDPDVVGWYARGPAPGERGTAVVVGHRDTRTGPAVFLNLDSLGPGNTVRVARKDGRVAVFTVDRVRTYPKDAFPDKEVYGSTGRPELRLLTCGGAFDRKAGYEANIVVYAHLTDIAEKI